MPRTALAPLLLVIVALGLSMPDAAHAYLDPGTGSAVIQMVVAGVMGALFVIKLYWRKLLGFFGMGPEEDPDGASGAANDERE